MKRLIIVNLFMAVLFLNGIALATPFAILSQTYNADGVLRDNNYDIIDSYDITQSTPTGFTSIINPETTQAEWLTFTDGGYLGSDSVFVEASGNAYAFAPYTRTENPEGGFISSHAISSVTFNPTGSFLADFSFYNNHAYDSYACSTLLIDGVMTIRALQSPQTYNMTDLYTIWGDPNEWPYVSETTNTFRLLVDPSKTYTIISNTNCDYASGGVHGSGGAALTVTAVPEPATMHLLGIGLIGLAALRRKFKSIIH